MKSVKIVEVGMRDGLQNEPKPLSFEKKFELAQKLIVAGVVHIELGAFVREDRVPQMANSRELIQKVMGLPKVKIQASALVPNEKGMSIALETPLKEVAFFTAASETFAQKNINCTIDESLARLKQVIQLAKAKKIKVRGYISTAFGCPYEGRVEEKKVIELAKKMLSLGCYEISIGDTIGVATPHEVASLIKKLKKTVSIKKIAGHFHDTRGTALANIVEAYRLGVRVFDSSIGGLGGCPYAPGAAGNVATEDVLYLFNSMKVKTGIDLSAMIEVNHWLKQILNLPSRVGNVGLWKGYVKN